MVRWQLLVWVHVQGCTYGARFRPACGQKSRALPCEIFPFQPCALSKGYPILHRVSPLPLENLFYFGLLKALIPLAVLGMYRLLAASVFNDLHIFRLSQGVTT